MARLQTLRNMKRDRRAVVVGCAGSGKTILAKEKARQLASEGFAVLFVCFNQPLARELALDADLAPHLASRRLTVSTFHELCRRLGTRAGVLPPQPADPGPDWFQEVLPKALEEAIGLLPDRYHAVIVDEGQDFQPSWLELLGYLTTERDDYYYLFHDPAQAIYERGSLAEVATSLGLQPWELADNCRNARPIHELAFRFYTGEGDPQALREEGRAPEVIEAAPGAETLEALRTVLHRLVGEEGVERADRVLLGQSLERSEVWHQRRFKPGNVLWNGSVDDAGKSLGLAADAVPAQPPGTIACETIHRFKGLERDVVVLCELRPDDERLGRLLYIGASRAKHHLVVIAPREVVGRLS